MSDGATTLTTSTAMIEGVTTLIASTLMIEGATTLIASTAMSEAATMRRPSGEALGYHDSMGGHGWAFN
jgi:hypothetical protein